MFKVRSPFPRSSTKSGLCANFLLVTAAQTALRRGRDSHLQLPAITEEVKGGDCWFAGQRKRSHGTGVRPWVGTRMRYFAQLDHIPCKSGSSTFDAYSEELSRQISVLSLETSQRFALFSLFAGMILIPVSSLCLLF